MPNIGQKVDLLFKKFIAQKAATSQDQSGKTITDIRAAEYYIESFNSRGIVTAEQVWTQSKYIPTTTNPLNKGALAAEQVFRVTPYEDLIITTTPASTAAPILTVNGKNIVQRIDIPLTKVPGSKTSFTYLNVPGSVNYDKAKFEALFGPDDKFTGYNLIPFSFDKSSTLYRYQIYKNIALTTPDAIWGTPHTLSGEITFTDGADWYFDQDSLMLNFYSTTNAHPTESELFVRAYRYVGKVGEFGGNLPGGSGIGEWQDSVTAYLTPVSTIAQLNLLSKNNTYAIATAALTDGSITGGSAAVGKILHWDTTTSKWLVRDPLNTSAGTDRFILTALLQNQKVYDPIEGVILPSTGGKSDLQAYTILEYWNHTYRKDGQSGWVKNVPDLGYFTSIDKDNNKIVRFAGAGSGWVAADFEATFSSVDNKDMVANATTKDGDKAVNIGLVAKPSGSGYIEVKVNGVAVKVGNGYVAAEKPEAVFAKTISNSYSTVDVAGNLREVSFTTDHYLAPTDQIGVTSTVSGVSTFHAITPVTVVSSKVIRIPDTVVLTGNPVFYKLKTNTTVEAGDILLWFGSSTHADYQLETDVYDQLGTTLIERGDRISYNFVRS
jgi:hypothetical protein